MQVSIDIAPGIELPEGYEPAALVTFALAHMECPDSCEVSMSFVDEATIQELNGQYRGIDTVTDVLSFECDDPFEASPDEPAIAVGDIVICPSVIDEQRVQFGTSLAEELSLMTVHSVLHLLGYDHLEPDERARMEALEKEILEAYGMPGIR